MSRLVPIVGLAAWIALLVVAPAAALAGWRAAFVVVGAIPIGALMLLLIARLTGAEWEEALVPLLRFMPWLLPAFVPVVAGQALLPSAAPHPLWLAWPWFALRGVVAILFWWWLARRMAVPSPATSAHKTPSPEPASRSRDADEGSVAQVEPASSALADWQAGLALVVHGVLLTIVGTDWLLGLSPGQPQSAVAMVMTVFQIGAAGAAVLLNGRGGARTRADLAKLMVAALIGAAYLLFVDYLIVWFGDLPARIGWYGVRAHGPAAAIPATAILLGVILPIVALSHGRQRLGGAGALAGLLLAGAWMTAAGGGALALLATITAAVALGGSARWTGR